MGGSRMRIQFVRYIGVGKQTKGVTVGAITINSYERMCAMLQNVCRVNTQDRSKLALLAAMLVQKIKLNTNFGYFQHF